MSGPNDTIAGDEIVGVIADVKSFGPEEETHPDLYSPIMESPSPCWAWWFTRAATAAVTSAERATRSGAWTRPICSGTS